MIWVDLDKFDLEPGTQVMMLDSDNIELSGNVSGQFPQTQAPFQRIGAGRGLKVGGTGQVGMLTLILNRSGVKLPALHGLAAGMG